MTTEPLYVILKVHRTGTLTIMSGVSRSLEGAERALKHYTEKEQLNATYEIRRLMLPTQAFDNKAFNRSFRP